MLHAFTPRTFFALATPWLLACWPCAASAQTAYARVLDASPIYEQVAVQREECQEFTRHSRCKTITTYEDQIVGYDVLYEHNGQQYSQRMAHKPGARIPIQTAAPGQHYSSTERSSGSTVTPGKKSYGSVAPGAPVVDSIEYHPKNTDIPVNVDIHMGRPPRRP